jgi:hypothetical protein
VTREEAQALAESEVLEIARGGHLKISEGSDPIGRAAAIAIAGMDEVSSALMSERADTGHIQRLAAVLIELLRECHLKHYDHYNPPPGQA